MKKFTLLASLLMFITLSYATNVIPVDDAMKASKNFLSELIGANANQLEFVLENTEYSADGVPVTYRFKVGEKGFIIASASELANPVLAFSLESNYKGDAGAKIYAEKYKKEISELLNNPSAALKVRNSWNHYLASDFRPFAKRANDKVAPLVTTRWTQEKYYNTLCPYNPRNSYNDDYHTPVGCVALTMANIMFYYRYPENGYGAVMYMPKEYDDVTGELIYTYPVQTANYSNTVYDYDAIGTSLSEYNGELARLLYHCGVATKMNYGFDGSGTQSEYAMTALQTHFFYNQNAQFQNISDVVTTDSLLYKWVNKAKAELDARRPLFYSGSSSIPEVGGHAWIVDGYTTIGDATYFHVNWGWAGQDNGYYLINNQNTTSSGSFNAEGSNDMMLSLMPDSAAIAKPAESFKRVTSSFGTISDGAGNMKYAQNSNRRWMIAAADATSYTFNFNKLEVKEGDKVIIYNGPTEASGIKAQFSGSYLPAACNDYQASSGSQQGNYEGEALPAAVTVNADSVLVVFTSTANSETDYGFVLSYKVNSFGVEGCTNKTVKSQTATLTGKPNDDINDDNYRLANVCEYDLQLGFTNRLVYVFDKFDLKEGDFVDIYNYKNIMTRELVAHYDIYNAPSIGEVFTLDVPTFNMAGSASSSRFTIRFASDNKDAGTGFELTYYGENTAISSLEDMKVNVYPNPAVANLNVEVIAEEAQQINAKVVDFAGRTIFTEDINHIGGTTTYQIPVNTLAKGVYFLHLDTNNGSNIQKFIVK